MHLFIYIYNFPILIAKLINDKKNKMLMMIINNKTKIKSGPKTNQKMRYFKIPLRDNKLNRDYVLKTILNFGGTL